MNIKERNIVTAIILSLVTCGLYGIYWAYCIGRDAVSVKDPEDNGLLEIVLLILLPFVGFYLTEKKFTEGCAARGIEHKDNSILYLILGLLGPGVYVALGLMQNELNKLATVE